MCFCPSSGGAKGLEQVDVGEGDGHAGAHDADFVFLAEAREADAVAERDGRARSGVAHSSRAPESTCPVVTIQPAAAGP